jgi:hypothetical protein
MFHSHIKFNNKVTYRDYLKGRSGSDLIVNRLKKYFSFQQMAMIEHAFEGFDMGIFSDEPKYHDLSGIASYPVNSKSSNNISEKFKNNLQKCNSYNFHLRTSNNFTNNKHLNLDEFILFQIMSNIIRNNGTFVPTDLKIEKWKTKKKM